MSEDHVIRPADMEFSGQPILHDPNGNIIIMPIGYPFNNSRQFMADHMGVMFHHGDVYKYGVKFLLEVYPMPNTGIYDTVEGTNFWINPDAGDNALCKWLEYDGKPVPAIYYNLIKNNKDITLKTFVWEDVIFHVYKVNSTNNPINLLYYIKTEASDAYIDSSSTPYVIIDEREGYWIAYTCLDMDSYYLSTEDGYPSNGQFAGTPDATVTNAQHFVGMAKHNLSSGDEAVFVIAFSYVSADDAASKARNAVANYSSAYNQFLSYWNAKNAEISKHLDGIPEKYHYYIYVACHQILNNAFLITENQMYVSSGLLYWNTGWIRDACRSAEGLVHFLPDDAIKILRFYKDVTNFKNALSYLMNFQPAGGMPMTDYGAVFLATLYEVYRETNDKTLLSDLEERLDDCLSWIRDHISEDLRHIEAPHPHDFWDDYSAYTSSVEKKYESFIDVIWCYGAKVLSYMLRELGRDDDADYCLKVYHKMLEGIEDYRTDDGGLWYAIDTNDQVSQLYTTEANIRNAIYFGDEKCWDWLKKHIDKFDYDEVDIPCIVQFDAGGGYGPWCPHFSETAIMWNGIDGTTEALDAYLSASKIGVQRETIGNYNGRFSTMINAGDAPTFPWSYGTFLWAMHRMFREPIWKKPTLDQPVHYLDPSCKKISEQYSNGIIEVKVNGIKGAKSFVKIYVPKSRFPSGIVVLVNGASDYTYEYDDSNEIVQVMFKPSSEVTITIMDSSLYTMIQLSISVISLLVTMAIISSIKSVMKMLIK